MITYPPGTRQRIRKYGFDQSRQLAKKISRYTGIPWMSCMRRKGRTMQKTLSSMERRINAERAYTLRDCPVQGKNILLIDDVITTGATVSACARLLRQGGANKVFPISIARTKRVAASARRAPSSHPWFAYRVNK